MTQSVAPRSIGAGRSVCRTPHTTSACCGPVPTMLLLAALLSVSYVAAIRVCEPKHLGPLPRNNVQVVRYRIRRVSLLCLVVLICLPPLLAYLGSYPSSWAVVAQFGIIPGLANNLATDLRSIASIVGKMVVLYAGPIANYLCEPQLSADWQASFLTLHGFRDHVFAPVTEEFVYRAAVISVLSEYLRAQIMVITPLLFGMAHLHHGYTMYCGGEDLKAAIVTVLFQFAYTTAFGGLSNKVYLDTHNLWAAVALHSICNLFGFPATDSRLPRIVYYCMLACGAVLFWLML